MTPLTVADLARKYALYPHCLSALVKATQDLGIRGVPRMAGQSNSGWMEEALIAIVQAQQVRAIADHLANSECTEMATDIRKLDQEWTRETDVGIIVPTAEEFRQLQPDLERLSAIPRRDDATGRHDYLFGYPSGGAAYRVAAALIGDMGPTQAAVATDQFIGRRNPRCIVVLGIAAAIDDDVTLGDVVVGTHVNNYLEKAKVVPSETGFEFIAAGEPFRCNDALTQSIRDLEFAHPDNFKGWQSLSRQCRATTVPEDAYTRLARKGHVREAPQSFGGPIACGPVVSAASEFLRWVKSINRKYLALEMESGGALAAVYSRLTPAAAVVLRGISDFGDQRKKMIDKIAKGALRVYAMRNVVHLLWAVLDAGLLPRSAHNG